MDLSSSSTQWIWAVKGGSAIQSNKQDSSLSQHDNMGNINFDLTVAKGGNSLNPFAAQAAPSGTTSSGSFPTSPATSGSGDTGASSSDGAKDLKGRNKAMVAHGAVMGLAFALIFPIGSILIRIFSFPGLLWVHAGTQLLAYTLAIVGLGLGIYIASTPTRVVRLFSPSVPGRMANPKNSSTIPTPSSAFLSSACSLSSSSSATPTTESSRARIAARSGPRPMSGTVVRSSRSASSTAAWVSSSTPTRRDFFTSAMRRRRRKSGTGSLRESCGWCGWQSR